MKLAFACLGVFTSIVAAGTLIPKCRLLVYKIVFYAIIANGLHVAIGMMEIFPVGTEPANDSNDFTFGNTTKWSTFCEVLGFLGQITDWSGHLCMTWVIVYVLCLLVKEKRLEESCCSKTEIVGVALCFLVPFTFNWIPFLHGFYGFTGSWCWIKTSIDKDSCKITEGLVYIVILYYGPLTCFVLFNIFSGSFIAVRYLFSPNYRSYKFSFVLVCYPLAYRILCIVDLASLVIVIKAAGKDEQQSRYIWIMEAIADSLLTIIPTLVVVLAFCRVQMKRRYRRNTDEINNEKKILLTVYYS